MSTAIYVYRIKTYNGGEHFDDDPQRNGTEQNRPALPVLESTECPVARHHVALKTGDYKAEDGRDLETLAEEVERLCMRHPHYVQPVRLRVLGHDRRRLNSGG